jgi:hypothetical protein
VDLKHGELGAVMNDGRFQRFAGDDLDPDHLAHGYAVTVHRSQGATVERAHALEDGGGRELAYVKMSRAVERTAVYAVADSVEQALEDLARTWAQSRRIGWAIDREGLAWQSPEIEAAKAADGTVPAPLRHARLVAEREAIAAAIPTDPGFAYHNAEARVRQLEHRLHDLERAEGWGVLRDTPVGEAAIAWRAALGEWRGCEAQAERAGPWERHQLRRRADRAAEREGPLREAFERLAAPERARIRAELPEAKKHLAELEGRYYGNLHFQIAHPEAMVRLERLDREIPAAAWEMDLQRQGLDGIAAGVPEVPKPARGLIREPPGIDRGLDLGLGL